ncbi:PEP-CTERM sorting domain-containing protein [Rubritalea spongiae]|uniref:PEP-CTERM sorting domain-containing protein n=1 Tax=Rubritalea spongiae TaxID=430797 RepID=A0ABW5DZM3_9BACT
MMKSSVIITSLLASASISQAATLYYQDFSASNPTSSNATNNPIIDNTLVTDVANGEVITGGNAAALATNGNYTITLTSVNPTSGGGQTNGYIFNPSGDLGFKLDDGQFIFQSGTINLNGTNSGTVSLEQRTNAGDEFFSINSISIVENDVNGEILLEIDYNYFADFDNTTDSLRLTTNFGTGNDVTALFIDELNGETANNVSGSAVYQLTLVAAVPEPSSTALLGLGGLALTLRRRR